jgi:hypothetical protein
MRRVNANKDVGSETLDLGRSPSSPTPTTSSQGAGKHEASRRGVFCVTGLKLVGFPLHERGLATLGCADGGGGEPESICYALP